MSNYTESGCLSIVEAAYKKCLSKPKDGEDLNTKINFVKNSELFSAWCLLSEQEQGRLANFAISKMHKAML